MEDRQVKTILVIIISICIVLIGGLSFTVMLVHKTEDTTSKYSTTTRRTTSSNPDADTEVSQEEVTSKVIPEEVTTEVTTTANNIVTTTTKKVNYTTTTTKKSTQVVITPTTTQNVVTTEEYAGTTTFPNAVDSWEWNIVNMINDARRQNGVRELYVSSSLRYTAEYYANELQYVQISELKDQINESFYARYSNQLSNSNGYVSLYNSTIANTSVLTKANVESIGVGVVFIEKGFGGLPTYYYVIIYK